MDARLNGESRVTAERVAAALEKVKGGQVA